MYLHCVPPLLQHACTSLLFFAQVTPVDSQVHSSEEQDEPSNTQVDNSTPRTTRQEFMVRLAERLAFRAQEPTDRIGITELLAKARVNQVSQTPASFPPASLQRARLTMISSGCGDIGAYARVALFPDLFTAPGRGETDRFP